MPDKIEAYIFRKLEVAILGGYGNSMLHAVEIDDNHGKKFNGGCGGGGEIPVGFIPYRHVVVVMSVHSNYDLSGAKVPGG